MTSVGALVAGRFAPRERLGVSPHVDTVLCRDVRSGASAVVKLARSRDADRSVRREARALERARHRGVVELLSRGEHRGRAYLATEHAPGPSLAALRARRGGALAVPLALRVITDVAEALEGLRQDGVIPGGVTGEGVRCSSVGSVQLTDLGLARLAPACLTDGPALPLRAERGETDGGAAPTPAQQVRALATLAHELLTGTHPREGRASTPIRGCAAAGVRPRAAPSPSSRHDHLEGLGPALDVLASAALSPRPEAHPAALVERLTATLAPFVEEPRILVADDDPDWRTLLGLAVRRALPEARVTAAHDGALARAQARSQPMVGALIDLDMPRANGVMLARALRRRYSPGLPLIAITGSPDSPGAEALRGLAHRVLAKPASPRAVAAGLRGLLRLPG